MRTGLLAVACLLVFVSAAIHLAMGVVGLLEAISGGGSVLLPALYLLGGLAALALLGVVVTGRFSAPITYAAGVGLMGLLVFAYADVHALGLAESTLGIETGHDHGATSAHDGAHSHDHGAGEHGHSHDHDHGEHADTGALATLASHLRGDTYALVSKAAEVGAGVLFVALLALERAR
ncbi:hypothetical protein [Halalkalicoccus jeotgali]|uniref:Uncharacterized protein n=1 Tax=Halalkalicoccus jeotgali (strain DSM 18796 / CECT 7217 / JCM 14584 / KCTC 4019 / B3) TaxID=795797 RepID=D8J863_HALJB|nr:hypothetical protein [Halalkalicoccus jeotgali]ADJ14176.1 hypothetical protein HacjB3_03925 [Halalkalicoccus jeotgali B3]ELY34642.1 hypothetical protein C497_15368 [Halalkalicoccus jeotgali B3]